MSVEQKLLTANDLWEMPEVPGKRFELVDGELIEMPGAGMLHNLIAALIYELIRDFAREHDLGLAFTDGLGYVIRRDPDQVRIPDASFVASDRLPAEGIPESFSPVAPDLAVEVVSPNDNASDLHEKVQEYLGAGVQTVWVVWPRLRSVTVHHADGTSRDLGQEDEIDGGDVLPGFGVPVASFFEQVD